VSRQTSCAKLGVRQFDKELSVHGAILYIYIE
jgi:hypothetical protein